MPIILYSIVGSYGDLVMMAFFTIWQGDTDSYCDSFTKRPFFHNWFHNLLENLTQPS